MAIEVKASPAAQPVPHTPEQKPDPCVVVIFGASGDLTKRKLLPALYHLEQHGLLPEEIAVVGVARRSLETTFAADMREGIMAGGGVKDDEPALAPFISKVSYYAMNFDDDAGYVGLKELLAGIDGKMGTKGNRLFYLATAPEYFADIINSLGRHEMNKPVADSGSWVRTIIEKPFGHDLESARALNDDVNKVFDEDQIFRIDHYLGKETVQNILVFRFANGIFENVWNRNYIDHVEITAAESIGIEGRGTVFYETAGALRDVVQNHVMELLSFVVAMEPPVSFEACSRARGEGKGLAVDFSRSIIADTVRGQYGPGHEWMASRWQGYRQEDRVHPRSQTETYAALRLEIENWRWAGVPFYIRAGKRLAKRGDRDHDPVQAAAPLSIFKDAEGKGRGGD